MTICNNLAVDLLVPAYTIKKIGLVKTVHIKVATKATNQITATGVIAESLYQTFARCINILCELKTEWQILKGFQYHLISKENNFVVKDARSAGMSVCISLLNLMRILSGKQQNCSLIGTGVLRNDGSFNKSNLEHIKRKACFTSGYAINMLTAANCSDVFDLEKILESI